VGLTEAAGVAAGPALHSDARAMAAAGETAAARPATAAGRALARMLATAASASRAARTLCRCQRYAGDEGGRRDRRQHRMHPCAPHANLPLLMWCL